MDKIKPLLLSVPYIPGETIESLVVRVAKRNLCSAVQMMTLFNRRRGSLPLLANWLNSDDTAGYQRWAIFTGLTPLELWAATIHRFAPVLTGPEREPELISLSPEQKVPIWGAKMGMHFVSVRAVQYCPECLREAIYQRQIWQLSAVAACVRHKRLLVDRCPGCQGNLSAFSVAAGRCQECNADLTLAQSPSIEDHGLGLFAQHLACAWLAGEALPVGPLAASLPQQSGRVLYHFTHRLVASVINPALDLRAYSYLVAGKFPWPGGVHLQFRRFSPQQRYAFWKVASRAVVNWPEGFYELMDVIAAQQPHGRRPHLQQLAAFANWRPPAFDFVREQYIAYRQGEFQVCDNGPSGETTLTALTFGAAGRRLGISPRMAQRLADLGQLAASDLPGFVEATSLMALKRQWAQPLTVRETAHWLGVAAPTVKQLAAREGGLSSLQPEPGGWRFSKATVCHFADRVFAGVHQRAAAGSAHLTALPKAAQTSWPRVSVADLLLAIAAGSIAAYTDRSAAPALVALLVWTGEIRKWQARWQ